LGRERPVALFVDGQPTAMGGEKVGAWPICLLAYGSEKPTTIPNSVARHWQSPKIASFSRSKAVGFV